MARCEPLETTITCDVCVVGAGPAGAVLAVALAASGKQVALIDQGPRYAPEVRSELTLRRSKELANSLTVDFNDKWNAAFKSGGVHNTGPDHWEGMRLAGAGGTSLHWNANTPRPLAEDFAMRTLFGFGRDFPITYGELRPWLLRAEHELGVASDDDNPYATPREATFPMPANGPTEFESEVLVPGAKRLGWVAHSTPWAINSRPFDGRPQCQRCRYCTACPSGARYSADRSHLLRLIKFPNAQLMTETKVIRLESAASGDRIATAHAVKPDGSTVIVKAASFVLAMGTVETTRMLLTSGQRAADRDGLGNAGGQLGVGFSDHLMNIATLTSKKTGSHLYGYPTRAIDHFRTRIDRRQQNGFLMHFSPGPVLEFPLSEEHLRRASQGGELSLSTLRHDIMHGVTAVAITEVGGPGRLSLDAQHRDSWGVPEAALHFALTDRDRAPLDASYRAFQQLATELGGDVVDATWSPTKKTVVCASHPGSSAAMGTSPASGACDTDCRVFGKRNLYLASGAVLPHQGSNNPTLEICAFALRLAHHLGAAA